MFISLNSTDFVSVFNQLSTERISYKLVITL